MKLLVLLSYWKQKNCFQNAEKEEYSSKQKEMEDIFNPIITKMYKDAGAGPQPGIIHSIVLGFHWWWYNAKEWSDFDIRR